MEQYISVPSGALAALHAQDFRVYALLRQVAEFPQPGVPLSVAAAQANLPFTTLLASMAVLRLRGLLGVGAGFGVGVGIGVSLLLQEGSVPRASVSPSAIRSLLVVMRSVI